MEVALGLLIIAGLATFVIGGMLLIGSHPDIAISIALLVGVCAIVLKIAT